MTDLFWKKYHVNDFGRVLMKQSKKFTLNIELHGALRKAVVILFLSQLFLPSTLSAGVILCDLDRFTAKKGKFAIGWFEKRYGYRYLYVDDTRLLAKLGTPNSWGETVRGSRKKISTGSKISWEYPAYDEEYNRPVKLKIAVRLHEHGVVDLIDIKVHQRMFKLKNSLECKQS